MASEREHVTLYIRNNKENYKIQNLEYVAYVDNFSIGEKNSSFSFVIYVH